MKAFAHMLITSNQEHLITDHAESLCHPKNSTASQQESQQKASVCVCRSGQWKADTQLPSHLGDVSALWGALCCSPAPAAAE